MKRLVCFVLGPLFFFSHAYAGQISGQVTDQSGAPVESALVFIYGTDFWTLTQSDGSYTLEGVPSGAPRYIISAQKDGYLLSYLGNVDATEDTTINIVLHPKGIWNSYKSQVLEVRCGYLFHRQPPGEVVEPPQSAIRDSSLYPDSIKPYLRSGLYMDPNSPEIEFIASEVLFSLPESLRSNATEVAKAAYLWGVTHLDYDLMSRYPGDVTCGNWQTVHGAWGENFAEWCYTPEEMSEERRGICIELERFSSTLLRALEIPARPAPLKAHPVTQWWAQTPDSGYWVNFETSQGIIKTEMGDTFACFPSRAESEIAFVPPGPDAPIHMDWTPQNQSLWIEPPYAIGDVRIPFDSLGLSRAYEALNGFAQTGEFQYSGPPGNPNEENYELYSRGFLLDLSSLEEGEEFTVTFPLFNYPAFGQTLACTLWTNFPEWFEESWFDTLQDDETGQSLILYRARFSPVPLDVFEAPLQNQGFEEGDSLPSDWQPISNPWMGSFFSLSDTAFEGSHSAYIRREVAGISAFAQSVPVEPEDVIAVEVLVKTQDVNDLLAGISVAFPPDPPQSLSHANPSGTQGWTRIWGVWKAPLYAEEATIMLDIAGVGEAWFDRVRATIARPFGYTGEDEQEKGLSLAETRLYSSFPNPFGKENTLSYSISKECLVELKVYDVTGHLVKTLVRERKEPGFYRVTWDGRNELGQLVPSGIYFYVMKALNQISSEKCVLLR